MPNAPAPRLAPAHQPGPLDTRFEDSYEDLKRLARARLWMHGQRTWLNTTALVHETWLRLADKHGVPLEGRGAFMAYAAQTMRSVIVDIARQRDAQKRGAGEDPLPLDTALEQQVADPSCSVDVLALHDALDKLGRREPRLAEIVTLRFFGGFSARETADLLGSSLRTVERDWEKARTLLLDALES